VLVTNGDGEIGHPWPMNVGDDERFCTREDNDRYKVTADRSICSCNFIRMQRKPLAPNSSETLSLDRRFADRDSCSADLFVAETADFPNGLVFGH